MRLVRMKRAVAVRAFSSCYVRSRCCYQTPLSLFLCLSVRVKTFGFLTPPLKMGQICCPETSVRNCHYCLRNNPEGRSSHLLRGGSLKSHKKTPIWRILMKIHVWECFLKFVISPIVWLISGKNNRHCT